MLLYDMQSHHCSAAGLCLKVKMIRSIFILKIGFVYCTELFSQNSVLCNKASFIEEDKNHVWMKKYFKYQKFNLCYLSLTQYRYIWTHGVSLYRISHLKSNYFSFISYKCQGLRKWSKTVYWQRERHINQKLVLVIFHQKKLNIANILNIVKHWKY